MFLKNFAKGARNPSFMTMQTYRRFAAGSIAQTHDVSDLVPSMPMYREEPKDKSVRRKNLDEMMEQYKLLVGLEFHVQIASPFKMFSSSRTSFNEDPNMRANYVDFACPGMLPVLNEDCLDKSIKCSLALAGRIPNYIKFDRKHYSYPDCPQGYQITQKHNPIMTDGRLFYFDCHDNMNHVLVERVQMEQDSAKMIKGDDGKWKVDFNRCGMPLLEIVTGAKWTTAENCKLVVREMQELLQQLEISDANIKQDSMRVDINLSVHGEKVSGPRVEIKSINNAKNVERAVEYEYRRQVALMENGVLPNSETRQFDDVKGQTSFIREMQDPQDYRFFQDPDLPMVRISNERISHCHADLLEVPFEVKRRFCNAFGLDVADTKVIFKNPWSVEMFTRIVWSLQVDPKLVFMWLYKYVRDACLKRNKDFQDVVMHTFGHQKLVDLVGLIRDKKVTQINAKKVMVMVIEGDSRLPSEICDELGFTGEVKQDHALIELVKQTASDNEETVKQFLKNGREVTLMKVVGAITSQMESHQDPVVVKQLLIKEIDDRVAKGEI